MVAALHRHQIAWLSASGWAHLLAGDWDAQARDCLSHWAAHQLPLVVTRQPEAGDAIALGLGLGLSLGLGLCAPQRWGRRRLPLRVARADVLRFDEFPPLGQLVTQLPPAARAPARQLGVALLACGATARVYGSHGWQHLTGLSHVREGSDLDVWVGVAGAAQADAVAAALHAFDAPGCRLDGELVFDGDAAVAWREWLAWRSGRVASLLVKRLHGASLPTSLEALA